MDKRTILAVVLSLAVLLAYQMFFAKPPTTKNRLRLLRNQSRQPLITAATTPATPVAAAAPKSVPKKTAAKKEAAPKDIKVETENYTAIFSTRGAALKSFQLKGYQKECTKCTADIYPVIKNFLTGTKQPAKSKRQRTDRTCRD